MRGIGESVSDGSFYCDSCFHQFISRLVAWYTLMTWDPDEDGGTFLVVQLLANRLGIVCATLNNFKQRLAVRVY